MRALLKGAADLFFPQVRCLSCDEPRAIDPGIALCDHCSTALMALTLRDGCCPHCLSPMRRDAPCRYCLELGMRYLSSAYSAFRYHGPSQRLITRLKFHGVHLAATPLIEGMLDALDGSHFDALVPVPLHKRRLRERGFNQAELLADGIAQSRSVPVLNALKRMKHGRRQSSLPHNRRRENVKDAFIAVANVQGMKLLLVDDVRTTGSTARACAKELLEKGALEVSLLTAAVAPAYPSGGKSSSG